MNSEDFQPDTCKFIRLVEQGRVEEAESLLVGNPGILTDRDGCAETALHWCVVENFVEGVRLLLAHGADPNTVDFMEESALHDAAGLGHADMVRILLGRGADPHYVRPDVLDSPLHAAARSCQNAQVFRLLLDAGVSADIQDDFGFGPLHYAVRFNNVVAVRWLLNAGADRLLLNGLGRTPLDEAEECKCDEIRALLKLND